MHCRSCMRFTRPSFIAIWKPRSGYISGYTCPDKAIRILGSLRICLVVFTGYVSGDFCIRRHGAPYPEKKPPIESIVWPCAFLSYIIESYRLDRNLDLVYNRNRIEVLKTQERKNFGYGWRFKEARIYIYIYIWQFVFVLSLWCLRLTYIVFLRFYSCLNRLMLLCVYPPVVVATPIYLFIYMYCHTYNYICEITRATRFWVYYCLMCFHGVFSIISIFWSIYIYDVRIMLYTL